MSPPAAGIIGEDSNITTNWIQDFTRKPKKSTEAENEAEGVVEEGAVTKDVEDKAYTLTGRHTHHC